MTTSDDELIRDHYRQVAKAEGASLRSSMADDLVRTRELDWIRQYRDYLRARRRQALSILDLGCGNGGALAHLAASAAEPPDSMCGLDFSRDLAEIAQARHLPGCTILQGDARRMPWPDCAFDFVYTERCLINILDPQEQCTALREIARVLQPGGDYLMIECFTDGLAGNNKARTECGLPAIAEAAHNRYFEKEACFAALDERFARVEPEPGAALPPWNFLSSYYFVSRVLYPALLHGGEVVRNSEVAKFFSFLPPMGNYSPIQAFVWRKKP
jgi:ubiquinone/menaquinone biosynthesis C-methylase UbiE